MSSLVLFLAVCLVGNVAAQVNFNGSTTNTAGNNLIPSTGASTNGCTVETVYDCVVSGTSTAVQSVELNLSHTWTGDLEIYLEAPNGQRIALSTDNGSSGDNFTNTVFDDAAATSITAGVAPFTGSFRPEGAVGGFCATPPAGTIATLGAFTPGAGLNGTWKLRIADSAFGDGGSMNAWAINFVAPPDPCVFTCPANITVNLDPGACSQVVDYNLPTYTGNCEVLVGGPFNLTQNLNTAIVEDAVDCGGTPTSQWRVYAPLASNFTINSLTMGNWNPGTIQVFVYSYTGPVGGVLDQTLMTLLGSSAATALPGGLSIQTVNFGVPPVVPAGTTFVVEQRKLAGGSGIFIAAGNYQGETGPAYISCGSQAPPLPGTGLPPQPYSNFGLNFVHLIQLLNGTTLQLLPPTIVQISGLPSGSDFPIGTTTNCFNLVNPSTGAITASCCFDVIVKEYPNPIQQLNCNNLVNISLDQDCQICLGADDVLEGGPYGCYDDYIVELDKTLPYGNGPWVPACLGPSDIGKTYQVRVTDPEQTPVNRCWGSVKVEDKIAPELTCVDYIFACNSDADPYGDNQFTAELTFVSNDTPVAILDNQTVHATIDVPISAAISDIDLTLRLTHTWVGDCSIVLTSPSGTTFEAWDNNCNLAIPGLNFRYDDESPDCFNACVEYNAGKRIQPLACAGAGTGSTDFLNKFDGEDMQGTWDLSINDNVNGDQGTLLDFQLHITAMVGAAPGESVPDVFEGCCFDELTYIDSEVLTDCASGFSKVISRKWTARDCSGNTSTCIQKISLLRPALTDVVLPPDYDGIDAPFFDCTDAGCGSYPTPDVIECRGFQGWPWVFGVPDGCNINWDYDDLVIEVCDGTYKIRREWTIIDWCIGDGFIYNQIIKVVDETGPAMACPANMTVSTDPFQCCAFVNLPDVIIEDNCSQISNISGMVVTFDPFTGEQTGMHTFGGNVVDFPGNNWWDLDTMGAFGWTPCLPQGTHTVTYIA